MNNTTNHITNTLLSKKNEELIVQAFLKLVNHITAKPIPKDQADWLASNDASHQAPAPQSPLESDKYRIRVLENQLAEANAKLSRRL